MPVPVNISEARTHLSSLVAAAVRGEEVVISRAGRPQVRLVPVDNRQQVPRVVRTRAEREAIAKRRVASIGMFKDAFAGMELSVEALKAHRADPPTDHES
jgi:prevent-host-death family protein